MEYKISNKEILGVQILVDFHAGLQKLCNNNHILDEDEVFTLAMPNNSAERYLIKLFDLPIDPNEGGFSESLWETLTSDMSLNEQTSEILELVEVFKGGVNVRT